MPVELLLPDGFDCLLLPGDDECLLLAEGADATTWLPGSALCAVYPAFRSAFWAGSVDVTDGTLAVQPVDGRVLYDPDDVDVSDLPSAGLAGPPEFLTGIATYTWTDGPASFLAVAADPVTTTGDVSAGPNVRALVVTYGTTVAAYLGLSPDTTQPDVPRDASHDWTFPAATAPWPYTSETVGPVFFI